jgi:hypothetical protein
MNLRNRRNYLLAVAALLMALPATISAQGDKSHYTDADQKELSSYTITVDKVQRMMNVVKAAQEMEDKDPALKAKWDKADPGKAPTLAAAAQILDQIPEAVAIIHKQGFSSTREYLVCAFSVLEHYMTVGMKRSGYLKQYPAYLSAANLAYIEQHWAELSKILETDPGSDK